MRAMRWIIEQTDNKRVRTLGLIAGIGLVGLWTISVPGQSRNDQTPPFPGHREGGYAAISSPSRSIAMAFTMSGVVADVPVSEGESVEVGDVVVRLDDDVQRFALEAQRISVEDDSELRAAEERLRLAEYDYQNVLDLKERGSTAPRELERTATELALREIDLTAAKRKREQNRYLFERDSASLEDMTLTSPISGIVARVEAEKGEAVELLQPVVHVIAIDPLWMDVAIPVELAEFVEPGSHAIVHWRDISKDVASDGLVLWISPVSDASSSTIVVRIEIDNPNGLPAGLHAKVEFPEALDALRRTGG